MIQGAQGVHTPGGGPPITYPMAVLIAAAALSLSAQVAEAKTSLTGWLLSAVPALAFLALSKLVLSRTTPTTTTEGEPAWTAENPTATTTESTSAPTAGSASTTAPAIPTTTAASAATPSLVFTDAPATTPTPDPAEDIPPHLITGARMAAFAHRQATGQAITASGLADHLGIPSVLAADLLRALGEPGDPADTPAPITHVNGTHLGSRL